MDGLFDFDPDNFARRAREKKNPSHETLHPPPLKKPPARHPKFANAERPLTPKGIQRPLLAHTLRQMEIPFDVIFSVRWCSRETADIVERGLRLVVIGVHRLSRRPATWRSCWPGSRASPAPASLLLVGHEPYLSSLISLLSHRRTESVADVGAGLCRLVLSNPLRALRKSGMVVAASACSGRKGKRRRLQAKVASRNVLCALIPPCRAAPARRRR
jgi:phosphohistidine phosphatase SixA